MNRELTLTSRMKRLVLNFGFVLGICAGVLAFFLFFYFANVHDNIEPHRAEAFKNSSDDETKSSEVDLVLKLQERMGFGHEALSVLDRFNKTDFRTINNLISSVEQFEDSSPSKTVNRLIIGELVRMIIWVPQIGKISYRPSLPNGLKQT